MTLAWVGQDDFAAGILRSSARGMEPGIGVITARNGLFDDDGDVYRRGGDKTASDAADGPITFLWSGYLSGNPKTIVATATKTYTLVGGVLTQLAATGIARPVQPAIVGQKLWLPNGKVWDGGAALADWTAHQHVAAIADRLVVADAGRVAFSASGDPAVFDPTDYHDLPDGVLVVGMVAVRDTLLVFSNYGLWTVTNMAFDLTDELGNPQQTLSRMTPEISLLHEAGIAEWSGKVIVPCVDRVYMVDPINNPVPISDSIGPLYMERVRAGDKPGGAKVFRNHLFMPMLNVGGAVTALMVCRLNRPIRGRAVYYPWSTFDGHGGNCTCLDVRLVDPAPRLSGGNRDGHVVDLTDVFHPSDQNASDVGASHEFELQLRDFPTGNGQPNHVKRLRLYYTLKGLGASVEAAYSTGTLVQTYEALYESSPTYQDASDTYATYEEMLRGGESSYVTTLEDPDRWWQGLPEQAFQSAGVDPVNWNFGRVTRTRYVRAWFRCSDPVSKLVIHRAEFGVRPATHQR